MLGEEIAASEYLAVVEVVEKTNEKPKLNCWTATQEAAIWAKVMRKANLAEDDVIFIYDPDSEASHRIGLRIINSAAKERRT
jgi:hypothetical protein